MTPDHPSLSPAPALAEWILSSRAELAAAFEAVQRSELRAIDVAIMVRDCERQSSAAAAGLQRGGAIRALLERESERLQQERERLSEIMNTLGNRAEAVCGDAGRFVGASSGLRERARGQIVTESSANGRLVRLSEEGLRLVGEIQAADARVGGIEDALRAISRRSNGSGA